MDLDVSGVPVVIPGPDPIRVPLAYPIGKRDPSLAAFVNTWIALKRKDGTLDATYKYWILGRIPRRASRAGPSFAMSFTGWSDRMTEQSTTSGLDRFLNLFTEVRPGEATTALLLALNVFLILMAYYVLKPVREALILGEGSAELKSYLSAGQVVVLALVVPFYGRLVARYARMKLINVVTVFFAVCPVIFYVLAQFGVPLAIVFFVWIGIFSLMIIAQFWAFANDVYTKEEGERLFVIVGFGASLGAVAGARIADRLIEPLGVYQLMLLGAAILLGQLWLTNTSTGARADAARRRPGVVRRQQSRRAATPSPWCSARAICCSWR